MTIILEKPARPTRRSFAGGEGTLPEIWTAARESLLYVENANAAYQALNRAYEDRIREVHALTGVQLENPLLAATEDRRRRAIERPHVPGLSASSLAGAKPPEDIGQVYERKRQEFSEALFAAGEKIPDRTVADRLMRSVEGDAVRLAREADENLARLMDSRPGLGKWAALLGGGMAGALADPVTIASLAAGGGPGAARTIAGRILATAGREALINAGTEAAIQPVVQAWRERIGLPHGLDEALRNVGFAGVFGGVIGAGGQGAAEIAGRFARRPGRRVEAEQAFADIAERQDLPEPVRAIAAGDGLRAADSLTELRPELPAVARGALDEAERLRIVDASRPVTADAEAHDMAVAAADRALAWRDDETWPGFTPDPNQIERVARAIAGEAVSAAEPAERSLARFLAQRGGIQDQSGELAQIGADRLRFSGNRRLVRSNGDTLDYAREAAAEAGFFDHLYGTPDEAVAKSTPADLIDALDAEIRGGRRADSPEAQLASLEGLVDEIARLGGPALPDRALEDAARLALAEGMDAGDALERVLVRAELDAEPRAPGTREEALPGWSDEDLLAASQNRHAAPEPAPDAAEPGRPLDPDEADEFAAMLETDPGMLIPTAAGEMTLEEINLAIRHRQGMASLVEACHV